MKHYKKTITMLLTTAVLLIAVFMTGCTKLSEAPNSTPSEVDVLAESDDFGVYVNLELVDEAYRKLLTDEARKLLDSAGCEDVEITWGSDPVEPVEAIMQTAGLRK